MELQKKDDVSQIYQWLNSSGNPYEAIGLDDDGSTSINWGVYGLPETFIVDDKGKSFINTWVQSPKRFKKN